jgi:fructokinase
MFLVAGEALYDVFPTGAADDRGQVALRAVPGGSPFNVAIGLARLGQPVGFLSGISDDPLGEGLAGRLRAEGVSDRYLLRRPEPTTLSLVGLSPEGAPRYTFYAGGADTAPGPDGMPALGPEVAGLHLGSYATVVPPVADALAALAARLRDRLVTLDPNVRIGVVPDPAAWRARIEALLPHAAAVKASDEDLGLLWPGRAPAAIAADWLARGPRLVVVTGGRSDVLVFHGAEAFTVAPPPTEVADTVGAGDAFQSALIDGLLLSGVRSPADLAALPVAAVRRVIERCARAGAIACTRRGAEPPFASELPRDLAGEPGS